MPIRQDRLISAVRYADQLSAKIEKLKSLARTIDRRETSLLRNDLINHLENETDNKTHVPITILGIETIYAKLELVLEAIEETEIDGTMLRQIAGEIAHFEKMERANARAAQSAKLKRNATRVFPAGPRVFPAGSFPAPNGSDDVTFRSTPSEAELNQFTSSDADVL